ncbi:MAG TPA: carboxypeptidase-like regulatory domain-containing protein [Thermoanaerobaculia bacterium]|jgi:hypothetical protein|nr:carboxypeptidase-like regulatory domain-containing protein [Thermoanaerobaculia bacterium]
MRPTTTTTVLAACLLLAARASQPQPLGEICTPGAFEPRPGISCQATDEFDYRLPYIANATKGNLLVSPGCGTIGELLRHVDANQRYSHSGVIVDNGTRVRHSTAADQRYIDAAGSDGFTPAVLKFGWPGTVTESIDEAYEGHYLIDPENPGRTYLLKSFNRDPAGCDEEAPPIYPAVVKPPFDQEETVVPGTGRTVRANLQRIADAALAIHGHYRLFAYSDAAIVGRGSGPGARAGSDAGWANLNAPDGTVCSQLAWSSTVAAGVPVEDDTVEGGDRPHAPAPHRGLFVYPEANRQQAGEFFYTKIYNDFYAKSGWWGRLFTDAPDDGANQILNCFGFDWCGSEPGMAFDGEPDAKDSDRWKHPGDGIAVSPDDLTRWDLPPAGVYGLAEDMAYRPGEYTRVHRWGESPGAGDVTVTTLFGGSPAASALVTISGFPAALTDAAGHAAFIALPGGRYEVRASKTVIESGSPREVTALQTFDVHAGPGNALTLTLTAPVAPPRPDNSRAHRRVTVRGTVWIKDYENIGSDEIGTHSLEDSVVLDPGQREHHFHFSNCTGDEVRVETDVRVTLDPTDASVVAEVRGKMFESDDCGGDDEDDNQVQNFDIAEGGVANASMHLTNSYVLGDDQATITLAILNERNTP